MFLGIDASLTGTGLALINDEYKIEKTLKLTVPHKDTERLFHLENLLLPFIEDSGKIKLICIEGPSYQSKEHTLFQLGEWAGIIKLNLFKLGIDILIAAPSQIKKYISGKFEKASKKELVILDIYKYYNEEIRDNDIADAYVASRIARDYYKCFVENIQDDNLKKSQIEVLKKIRDSKIKNEDRTLI